MARFRNKKKVAFVKPVGKKQQQQNVVDHITGDRIPRSFVFSRGKLPGSLKQLQADLRKLMLPYTALKLKEKKRNNLKDFLNVAGPMGVTHFLMLSKTATAPYLRVAKTPQGPTLTFKIHEYSLAIDVARSQLRPRCPKDLFSNSPLIVLSGFGKEERHLSLVTTVFQNIFPAIDINTDVIEDRMKTGNDADEVTKISQLESEMEAKVNKKVQANMAWLLTKLGEANPSLKVDCILDGL